MDIKIYYTTWLSAHRNSTFSWFSKQNNHGVEVIDPVGGDFVNSKIINHMHNSTYGCYRYISYSWNNYTQSLLFIFENWCKCKVGYVEKLKFCPCSRLIKVAYITKRSRELRFSRPIITWWKVLIKRSHNLFQEIIETTMTLL